jgi:hypothetical protein
VCEQEARVHDVILLITEPVGEIADPELDVGHGGLRGVSAGEVDLRGVDVQPHHLPSETDKRGQVEAHVTTTAADIETTQACSDTRAIEQRQRCRPHHPTEDTQPLSPFDPTPDQIVVVAHRASSGPILGQRDAGCERAPGVLETHRSPPHSPSAEGQLPAGRAEKP